MSGPTTTIVTAQRGRCPALSRLLQTHSKLPSRVANMLDSSTNGLGNLLKTSLLKRRRFVSGPPNM